MPYQRDPGYRYRLTPTESRVAELLVQGLSNRQIASTLNVGVKRVENCVSEILAKLEVPEGDNVRRRHQAIQLLQARMAS